MKIKHSLWFAAFLGMVSLDARSETGGLGLQVEGGVGKYGMLGFEVSRMLTDNGELHAGVGVGGDTMWGIGGRAYTDKTECAFFKSCGDRYFIDTTVAKTSGSEVTVDSDGSQRKFKLNSLYIASLALGSRMTFFEILTTDLSLGYRWADKQAKAELIEGVDDEASQDSADEVIEGLENGPLVSIGLGFVF